MINDNQIIRTRSNSQIVNEKKKKKSKISEEDFYILDFHEYKNMNSINYNVKQLKELCKYYKIKVSGNKIQLEERIYKYLSESCSAIMIQKNIRKLFCKLHISLRGPALFDRSVSTNQSDFYTFDNIDKIPVYNFVSWREDKNIFSFDIYSLHELINNSIKNKSKPQNPYTRNELSKDNHNLILKLMRLNNLFGVKFSENKVNVNIQPLTQEIINSRITDICLRIDSLGNYTDVDWFKTLGRRQIIKFVNVLHDIWNYRAQIPENVKREISAPVGRPFAFVNSNYHYLCNADILSVKMIFIKIIENFINKGINDSSSSLGAMYVLSALTLVNEDAANAMPWLFQSVAL